MTAENVVSADPTKAKLQQSVAEKVHSRKASLTDVEQAFLRALLIDDPAIPANDNNNEALRRASRRLDDDMLFSVPENLHKVEEDGNDDDEKKKSDGDSSSPKKNIRRPSVKKDPHLYRFLVGLWQAHEDGVTPKRLSILESKRSSLSTTTATSGQLLSPARRRSKFGKKKSSLASEIDEDDVYDNSDEESAKSDQEVRTADDVSDCSWDEDDGGYTNFDAWQVLKDEYAKESGFDYTPDGAEPSWDDSIEHHTFKILGTSADDVSAHPHVLSPPLIDSLMNFVPEHLEGQNLWMKYSLVRDGASLDTFKQYVRASKDTILAIETTKGHVFGSYTSSAWRTTFSFFGGTPSFVWRMRHNRNSPCHSLIEQAQLESEIDVHFLLDSNSRAQCLRSNLLGVGEGDVDIFDENDDSDEEPTKNNKAGDGDEVDEEKGKNYGFAISLTDDLLSGTTSRCSSYTSPCLVDITSKGETFEVLNLELWTFTPCFSLDSAEKLEMTQFFVSESMRNTSINSVGSNSSEFSSRDLSQDQFYRRIGQGDDHEELRERWQYRNMMDGGTIPNRGFGATPRFNNALS